MTWDHRSNSPRHDTTTKQTYWTTSRKWGILRVLLVLGLCVFFVGINSAIDKWKRDNTGGRDGNMEDGNVLYTLPHSSFRDYSHRGLQHATNYFMNHRNGAEVMGRFRDALLCIQGLWVLIMIYRNHGFGCRFIIEWIAYIILREFATIMYWEPIPQDAVLPSPSKIDADTDHFFSGHVCTSLLATIEIIRITHPYPFMTRLVLGFLHYTISLYIIIVQLILRVHYFDDIFCAIFVAHTICATYHLLELHHHIPYFLMDQYLNHTKSINDTHSCCNYLPSVQDTEGHLQFQSYVARAPSPNGHTRAVSSFGTGPTAGSNGTGPVTGSSNGPGPVAGPPGAGSVAGSSYGTGPVDPSYRAGPIDPSYRTDPASPPNDHVAQMV